MRDFLGLAEDPLAFQEGLGSMELVSYGACISWIYRITLHYTLDEGNRTLQKGNVDRILILKKQVFLIF